MNKHSTKKEQENSKYFIGYGIGKTSTALVALFTLSSFSMENTPKSFLPSDFIDGAQVYVNSKTINSYFASSTYFRNTGVEKFLDLLFSSSSYSAKDFMIFCKVHGGGISSQLRALKHAISSSILEFFARVKSNDEYEQLKRMLRSDGMVSVDNRQKEKKKPGQPKARRKRQFSKR